MNIYYNDGTKKCVGTIYIYCLVDCFGVNGSETAFQSISSRSPEMDGWLAWDFTSFSRYFSHIRTMGG